MFQSAVVATVLNNVLTSLGSLEQQVSQALGLVNASVAIEVQLSEINQAINNANASYASTQQVAVAQITQQLIALEEELSLANQKLATHQTSLTTIQASEEQIMADQASFDVELASFKTAYGQLSSGVAAIAPIVLDIQTKVNALLAKPAGSDFTTELTEIQALAAQAAADTASLATTTAAATATDTAATPAPVTPPAGP